MGHQINVSVHLTVLKNLISQVESSTVKVISSLTVLFKANQLILLILA